MRYQFPFAFHQLLKNENVFLSLLHISMKKSFDGVFFHPFTSSSITKCISYFTISRLGEWRNKKNGEMQKIPEFFKEQQIFHFPLRRLVTKKNFPFAHSEKADLKPRHDNSHIGVPHLDSIYTTSAGFHHPHHPHNGIHHGSPEAMKVRMAAMVLSPPTRV